MNKYIIIILSIFFMSNVFAQEDLKTVLNTTAEIKDEIYNIRAYKDETLFINISTGVKSEKKGTQFSLNNVKVYRQNASNDFQYIIDKNDVSELNVALNVPNDGIYTIVLTRGGLRKFETTIDIKRSKGDQDIFKERNAFLVQIPDTVHTYKKDSVIYDHIRMATPQTKRQRTPQYFEDQVFMDVSYALRIDNKYVIPISLPQEILTDYKIAKSVEVGFTISVGDEVYKALQKKVADVASAAISAGMGKAMSGKTDEVTGIVSSGKLTKAYEVFDKASTINEIAGITGDVGKQTDNKNVEAVSDVVQVITGFTGLTDIAGEKIAMLTPKIGDKVIFKLLTQPEYQKYLNKEPHTVLKEGKDGMAKGTFEIRDHRMNYYLIIENERSLTKGGAMDIIGSVGKTILSQYVYANVKVFVKRKVEVTYDKGYYETSFLPVYNTVWNHSETVTTKNVVVFEEEIKPYYKVLKSSNIY